MQILQHLPKVNNKKCIDTANNYACNATLIKVHTIIQHNNFNCVKKCLPIPLSSPLSATLLTVRSILFVCSVVELASQLIVHHQHVLQTHTCATSHILLCDKSLRFVLSKHAAGEIPTLLATPFLELSKSYL
jgi:hypothetical protein